LHGGDLFCSLEDAANVAIRLCRSATMFFLRDKECNVSIEKERFFEPPG
jgi:hypothetical protein